MKTRTRFIAFFLLLALLCPFLPVQQAKAAGNNFGDSNYSKIGHLPNDYVATQGMCADENYVYTLKTPSGGYNQAIIYRTSIHTGSTVALTNAENTSTTVLNGLGHGNDMCAVEYNGKTYLYVTTMYHVGHAEYSAHTIWKLEVSGNTVRKVAYYDVNDGSNPINFVSLTLHSFDNGTVKLLASISSMVFYIDIGINQGSGSVRCNYICPLNYNSITVPTNAPGYSGTGYYEVQGMTYNNGYLYFVMTAKSNNTPRNKNYIIGYDLSNLADGSQRNNVQAQTTYLTSSYYWYFLEIESVDCVNGRMYFSANAGSSSGYYNNEDFVGCFSLLYDTDPNGMLLDFESGSRETNWNWRHYISASGASISPNPTAGNGYLSGTLGALTSEGQTSSDSYVRMTAFDVLYKIKSGDIVEIGFDYTHISGTAPNSAAVFFTTNTIGYFTADRMFAGNTHTFHNGRNVLQFALSASSGGAVGEFISQLRIDLFDGGSNDFKANYAIDYIYIGNPLNSPQNKADYLGNGEFVFMDFVASAPMSANNNWSGNAITALVDLSTGTLNGNITGGDPFLCTERMPGVKIKDGDVIEIRMKTTITSGNAGHLEVFYATDQAPGYSGERYFALPIYATGQYQVAYIKLPSNVVGHTLTNIRIDPVSSGADEPLKGSYTIDYIYAGTPNKSPQNRKDHTGGGRFLLVDFDKEAPLCETGNWITHNSSVTGNTASGILKGTYKGGDPYIVSSGEIRYQAQKGDVVEFRLKSNLTSGTPNNVVEFFYTTLNSPNYDGQKYVCANIDHDNAYHTIRVTLPDNAAGQIINGIRLDPMACGESEPLAGSFEVDYIYLGPKDQAPASIFTVQFYDANGKLLQEQTISEGDTATYTGATPTKTSDEQKHYIFAGWVDSNGATASLDNIRSDLKVYASFKAEGHRYTGTVTKEPTCSQEGVEVYSCPCGMTFNDPLPKTDHVTELVNVLPATCSTAGYSGDLVCKYCGITVEKGQILPTTDHNPVTDPAVPSTCTTTGLSEGSHCGTCGMILVQQEPLPLSDHSAVTVPGTPSTCTTPGLSHYSYCAVCGEVLEAQTILPLADHSPETIPGTPASCLSSGLSEGQKCKVCGYILIQQSPLPRLGHSYIYENLGDTHVGICIRCEKTKTEDHSYTDGLCVCGKAEAQLPILDSNLRIQHNLNLASDIAINYVVAATALSTYDSFTLRCSIPVYEGNDLVSTREITVEPTLKGNYYYFTLEGLTAVHMNDTVIACLYLEKDGQAYISTEDTYSIATYAYAQLRKTEVAPALKSLCANLLQYGAAAQRYKGYRTDSPADGELFLDELLMMTELSCVSFGNVNELLNDTPSPSVKWVGKSLDLNSKVTLNYVIDLSDYTGSKDDLSLHICYTDIRGEECTAVLTELQAYGTRENCYVFSFDGLLAAELRQTLSATVYAGNTPVSQTLRYSPDTSGNNKTGSLLTLCQALIAYSDSANAYFAG